MKKYLLLFLFLLFSSCIFCLELSDSEAQRLQEIFLQLEKLNQDSKTRLMQAEQKTENLENLLHQAGQKSMQAEQKTENLETLLEENNTQMQQLKNSYRKEKTFLILSNAGLLLGIIGVIIFI